MALNLTLSIILSKNLNAKSVNLKYGFKEKTTTQNPATVKHFMQGRAEILLDAYCYGMGHLT